MVYLPLQILAQAPRQMDPRELQAACLAFLLAGLGCNGVGAELGAACGAEPP